MDNIVYLILTVFCVEQPPPSVPIAVVPNRLPERLEHDSEPEMGPEIAPQPVDAPKDPSEGT